MKPTMPKQQTLGGSIVTCPIDPLKAKSLPSLSIVRFFVPENPIEEVCTPPFHNSAVTDIGSQVEPDRMNSIMICRYA